MSQIDPTIPLGVKPVQIESPMNAMLQFSQLQGAQTQNALLGLKMQQEQRTQDETTRFNSLWQSAIKPDGTIDDQALIRGAAGAGLGSKIPALQEAVIKRQKDQREADKAKIDLQNQVVEAYRDGAQGINDPQSAAAFVSAMHKDPRLKDSVIAQVPLEQVLAKIPQDPAQFGAWKQEFSLGAKKFIELNKPTTSVVNAGGTSQVLQTPGLGGAPQPVATVAHTATPGEILTDTRTRSEGALNRGAAAARQQETIAAENLRAGVTPGGGLDDNAERTAQAIASGQLPPPTGMALLNPKNQRILGRVMEINPQYDATTVEAKRKAARDFSSGTLGNSMRSFAVAGQHLDQLGQLVDALDNKNLQIVNRIGNAYATQTGNPAPTNFDAAKDVVSKEVVKAIVAGGGGVTERAELKDLMDKAKSPAQLKGVIQQYRNLMGAQHEALLQQRDAAGLPRSTLPNYNEAAGSPPAAAPQPAGKAGAPVRISSDAEFEKLPSGAAFIGPDGKARRKP